MLTKEEVDWVSLAIYLVGAIVAIYQLIRSIKKVRNKVDAERSDD